MLPNQYKQVFRYHPRLGYWYREKIDFRVQSQSIDKHYYRIATNKIGARCNHDDFSEKKKKKLLFLGCSFTAGDGVSNGFRFTDIIEKENNDLKSFNYALSGSGNDQQLIIKNIFEKKINPDFLILSSYTGCIGRNVQKSRIAYDQLRGVMINRPKPYFQLKKNKIVFNHKVVPKAFLGPLKLNKNNDSSFIKFSKKLFNLSKGVFEREKWLDDQMYYSKNATPYILSKLIIKKLVASSNAKKKILMPLPSPRDFLINKTPNYINFFKSIVDELNDDNLIFFNIYSDIKKLNNFDISSLFFSGDGHPNRKGHNLIANYLLNKLDNSI